MMQTEKQKKEGLIKNTRKSKNEIAGFQSNMMSSIKQEEVKIEHPKETEVFMDNDTFIFFNYSDIMGVPDFEVKEMILGEYTAEFNPGNGAHFINVGYSGYNGQTIDIILKNETDDIIYHMEIDTSTIGTSNIFPQQSFDIDGKKYLTIKIL